MTAINIFWFRRDLRLEDNVGLYHALSSELPVLPIFIFDTDILNKLPKDDARVTFIHECISRMNDQLAASQKTIAQYHGNPIDIFETLTSKYTINTVYTNHDYEPYAIHRDQKIKELLQEQNIEFHTWVKS